MGNYSKLVAVLVGTAFGYAGSRFGLPADLATPEIQGAVTLLIASFLVFIFPANKPS